MSRILPNDLRVFMLLVFFTGCQKTGGCQQHQKVFSHIPIICTIKLDALLNVMPCDTMDLATACVGADFEKAETSSYAPAFICSECQITLRTDHPSRLHSGCSRNRCSSASHRWLPVRALLHTWCLILPCMLRFCCVF